VVAAYSCLTGSQASIQLGGRPPGAHLAKRECAGRVEEHEGRRLGLLSEEWSTFNRYKQYFRGSLTSHSALDSMPAAQNCWGKVDFLDHDLQQDHTRARYRCLQSRIQLSYRCSCKSERGLTSTPREPLEYQPERGSPETTDRTMRTRARNVPSKGKCKLRPFELSTVASRVI
jgi:hypothetical protein